MAFSLSSPWMTEGATTMRASPSYPSDLDEVFLDEVLRDGGRKAVEAPPVDFDPHPRSDAAPAPADADARSAESPQERWEREARTARRFIPWLAASLTVHALAITVIALWDGGPAVRVSDPSAIEVELAQQPPAGQKSPSSTSTKAEAVATPAQRPRPQERRQTPALAKPPPEPSSRLALAKPPPEPAPKARAARNKARAPKPPAPVAQMAQADPATALPFFTMPNAFASNVLDGHGSQGDDYKGLVFGMLARAKRFPASARARGETGQAIVAFSVDDKGALASLSLARSSGFPDLDAEALAIVRRVAPFPPPPAGAVRSFAAAIAFGQE